MRSICAPSESIRSLTSWPPSPPGGGPGEYAPDLVQAHQPAALPVLDDRQPPDLGRPVPAPPGVPAGRGEQPAFLVVADRGRPQPEAPRHHIDRLEGRVGWWRHAGPPRAPCAGNPRPAITGSLLSSGAGTNANPCRGWP